MFSNIELAKNAAVIPNVVSSQAFLLYANNFSSCVSCFFFFLFLFSGLAVKSASRFAAVFDAPK